MTVIAPHLLSHMFTIWFLVEISHHLLLHNIFPDESISNNAAVVLKRQHTATEVLRKRKLYKHWSVLFINVLDKKCKCNDYDKWFLK
jgi:hypothetical protein